MKVAVLSLTRDRLNYTQHTFPLLYELAGCQFDHFVLDQGSDDLTVPALIGFRPSGLVRLDRNIGISRGMNVLLEIIDGQGYDVVVKFDNDCELLQPDTLAIIAKLALEGDALLSPRILGLQNPPRPTGEFMIGGETVLDIPQIGGIFLAAPASLYEDFRFNPDNPIYGGDDVEICAYARMVGMRCGYVERFAANHYEGTEKQRETYPEYWERKKQEMGLVGLA